MKLYEICEAIRELSETETDEQFIIDTLESLNFDFDNKVKNIAGLILEMRADIVSMKEAEARIKTRREAKQKNLENFERYLTDSMNLANKHKLSFADYDVTLKKPAKKVFISDEIKLFSLGDYTEEIVTYKLNIADISADLKAGKVIQGAELVDGKQALLIK